LPAHLRRSGPVSINTLAMWARQSPVLTTENSQGSLQLPSAMRNLADLAARYVASPSIDTVLQCTPEELTRCAPEVQDLVRMIRASREPDMVDRQTPEIRLAAMRGDWFQNDDVQPLFPWLSRYLNSKWMALGPAAYAASQLLLTLVALVQNNNLWHFAVLVLVVLVGVVYALLFFFFRIRTSAPLRRWLSDNAKAVAAILVAVSLYLPRGLRIFIANVRGLSVTQAPVRSVGINESRVSVLLCTLFQQIPILVMLHPGLIHDPEQVMHSGAGFRNYTHAIALLMSILTIFLSVIEGAIYCGVAGYQCFSRRDRPRMDIAEPTASFM